MGTIWFREFRGGLDARRVPETSAGGTLLRGRDGHINRGGEFEQRSDFVQQFTLPEAQTKGFAATPDKLYVFGHQSVPPALPAGLTYMQLAHPGGEALASVPYATLFKAKMFVIGEFSDGSAHLFYDGVRVADAKAPPNAAGSGNPAALLTYQQKMFVASGPSLFSSAVAAPADFGSGVGAGAAVIDMSTHSEGGQALTGLARYDQYAAIFARNAIQIWFLDPDPALSRQAQVLTNVGTPAPRSVTQFGDGDVFFLDRAGIRSLRARDSSNSAATTDIGSAIDPLVRDALDGLSDDEMARAKGVIEPRDGRFWLVLGDTIYVLSYFTASKVSAWTEYRPGFAIDDIFVRDDVVWLRSGETVYTFGDATGRPVYSANVGEMWTPYLDADAPFRAKSVNGVDAALRGLWEVRLAMTPTDETHSDLVARLDTTTFGLAKIPAHGEATHLSLRFKCLAPPENGPGLVSSCVIHFERNPQEDSE